MTESLLYLDFETRSRCNLKTSGAYRYAEDPSTEVLVMAYAYDDGEISVRAAGESFKDALYGFKYHIKDGGKIVAHNAQFERLIMKRVLGMDVPVERFLCTATQARTVNLPGGLDDVAGLILGKEKMPEGGKLISFFSIPQRGGAFNSPAEHPEKWEMFKEYCVKDVELERELYKTLPAMTQETLDDYYVSEKVNDNGIPVDVDLAEAAVERAAILNEQLLAGIKRASGGELTKLRGITVTKWIYDNLPDRMKRVMDESGKLSLDRGTRRALLENAEHIPTNVLNVIKIVADASNSSVAKYRAMLNRHVYGRVCGSYILNGATATGRYSARGVQPQNLPRTTLSDPEKARKTIMSGGGNYRLLKQMLRPAIVAPTDRTFIGADLSQIEGRVLPWLSDSGGGREKLKAFATPGRDIYCETASNMLGREVTPEDKDLRQNYGKIPELAFGFGGAVGALMNTARSFGVTYEHVTPVQIVKRWRKNNRWCVEFWGALSRALNFAHKYPGEVFEAGRVAYRRIPDTATIQCALPGGSLLNYHDVRRDEDGELCAMHTRYRPKVGEKRWPSVRLWHGILAENITQAVAARVQRCIIKRLVNLHQTKVIMHSHDEVLIETSEGGPVLQVGGMLTAVMQAPPEWAEGLPLGAEGWHGKYYGK